MVLQIPSVHHANIDTSIWNIMLDKMQRLASFTLNNNQTRPWTKFAQQYLYIQLMPPYENTAEEFGAYALGLDSFNVNSIFGKMQSMWRHCIWCNVVHWSHLSICVNPVTRAEHKWLILNEKDGFCIFPILICIEKHILDLNLHAYCHDLICSWFKTK